MRILVRMTAVLTAIFAISTLGDSAPVSRDRILQQVDPANISAVRGTAHPRARMLLDQGRTDPSRIVSGTITFPLSAAQQGDLDQLLRDQQDPKSPDYHRWL